MATTTFLENFESDLFTFALKPSPPTTSGTTPTDWSKKVQDIDKLLQQIEKKQAIIGTGVGVVADGKVVFTKGYGIRDLADSTSKVSEKTLFGIGSVTKQFTAYGFDQLINVDGLLSWNDLVLKHIPEFRMYDVFTTNHIQLRDCASHHSGLPRHELCHLYSSLTMEGLLDRIPYLKPMFDLRQAWQYNSIMYGVLGVVMQRVTRQSWSDFTYDRVLKPNGMTNTYTSIDEAKQVYNNIATPHTQFEDGSTRAVDWNDAKPVEAAGSIVSTVEDMSKWLVTHLQLSGQSKEMHLAQASIPADPTGGDNFAYGYAWMLALNRGKLMVWHSGVTDGFISRVTIFPELNQGVVVLANSEALKDYGKQLSLHIADILSGYSTSDSKAVQDWVASLPVITRTSTRTLTQSTASTETVSVEDYVADYEDPGYGIVSVTADASGTKLVATYNSVEYELQPRWPESEEGKGSEGKKGSKEAFISVATKPRELRFGCLFVRDIDNDVCGYKWALESSLVEPIHFVRKVSPEFLTPEYLMTYVSVYAAGSTFVVVNLNKNHTLGTSGAVQFTGQLKPIKRNKFLLVAASPARFEFTLSTNGSVSGVDVKIGEYGVSLSRMTK